MSAQRLWDHHLEDLRRSGLTDETILAAGIVSAPEPVTRELLGFGVGPGMVIHYPGTKGNWYGEFAQVKPDKPPLWNGKPAKYVSPKNGGNWLYIPATLDPAALANPAIPLYVTEGAKKVLKANQDGLPTIGVLGVWSWKGKQDGRSVPIPDLDRIVWRGRTVHLVFDSDLAVKDPVRWAEFRLAQELRDRGARVLGVRLPGGPNGAKVGIDDFLCGHSVETFCALEPVPIEHPVKAKETAGPVSRSLGECFRSYLRDLQDPLPRVRLGYPSLDRWFRGLARGEMCMILARTSVGKTTFAQNILERTAVAHQIPTQFFSLEMSGEEIVERILAKGLAASTEEVAALIGHADSRVAHQAPRIVAEWDHWVRLVDAPCRLKDIEAALTAAPETRLVVVDYLGMLVPTGKGSLYEITSEAARSLKRIAGAHRVAMIVLAQIGRQGESGGVPVTLRDARDSGSIEEAANSLLGCWRPDLAEEGSSAPPAWPVDLKVRILKQRGGARGQTVTLKYHAPHMCITDPSEEPAR